MNYKFETYQDFLLYLEPEFERFIFTLDINNQVTLSITSSNFLILNLIENISEVNKHTFLQFISYSSSRETSSVYVMGYVEARHIVKGKRIHTVNFVFDSHTSELLLKKDKSGILLC